MIAFDRPPHSMSSHQARPSVSNTEHGSTFTPPAPAFPSNQHFPSYSPQSMGPQRQPSYPQQHFTGVNGWTNPAFYQQSPGMQFPQGMNGHQQFYHQQQQQLAAWAAAYQQVIRTSPFL